MHVSLGAQPFCLPLPVLLVGTYDASGRANLATAVYGGICSLQPPSFCVSMSRGSWTHRSIAAVSYTHLFRAARSCPRG